MRASVFIVSHWLQLSCPAELPIPAVSTQESTLLWIEIIRGGTTAAFWCGPVFFFYPTHYEMLLRGAELMRQK